MKLRPKICIVTTLSFAVALLPTAKLAAAPTPSPAPPSDAEMMAKMMELAKPGPNHQLLAQLAGNWDYKVKVWMIPGAPAVETGGTATRRPIMDGRYFVSDVTGKIKLPGPDGKMMDMDFKGMSIEGYDNVRQKFLSTWVDNMGTSILLSEGTYDPATKAFTYNFEMEMMPGMKTKGREVVKVVDQDHHVFEWYEQQGGKEVKTMEISYTRAK